MISDKQTPEEWLWFLDQVAPVNSLLEIGSYNGNSLLAWGSSDCLLNTSIVRAIDLGNHGTATRLREICDALKKTGLDIECLIGNSRFAATEDWARQWAPYDVVFIDGDHTYEGVKADWEQYGSMGKVVAFHDIGGCEAGCVKFWKELKATGVNTLEMTAHQRYQIVTQGPQGIGIVLQK